MSLLRYCLALLVLTMLPDAAHAAALDGRSLGIAWAIPFAGILATIALGPLLFKKLWHDHYAWFAFGWAAAMLIAIAVFRGPGSALDAFAHALFAEYMSFILLLFALYVVAGGLLVTGNLRATPGANAGLMAFGAAIASVVGTTGAAMILIRPLLRANEARRYRAHIIVFFIFLVANIGGALSPLGDPPLFVGYLRGVDFFWTTGRLLLPTLAVTLLVLGVFFAIDTILYRREGRPQWSRGPLVIRVRGIINLLLIAAIIGSILAASTCPTGITVSLLGVAVKLENLLRDLSLVAIAFASLWLTPDEHREANGFTFEPIREVAILFAGIFVCILPVLAMLDAGRNGAFAALLGAVTQADGTPNNAVYFWMTGMLSAFLDNAPTYLVFFELAGGDAAKLMGPLAGTLAAISMGAVYMGAMTYIGNAPNLMVLAIAEERGVSMPSFFGYMVWSFAVMLPILALVTVLFIH